MPVRSGIVRFGVFELDLTEGVLMKRGHRINLQEQPFRLLSILVQHPDETVTRDELRQALWPADTFVDFDRGLNAAMAKLRHALGDSADNPRFIATQARRGYRFIAPVTAPVEAVAAAKTDPLKSRFSGHFSRIRIAAVLILLIGGAILYYTGHRSQSGALAHPLSPPVPLTTYHGFQRFPTMAPDGTRVAFAWAAPGKRASNIYAKLIGSGEAVALTTGDKGDLAPAWSPDGRSIAFLRLQGPATAVMLIPSLGGPEKELSRVQLDAARFVDYSSWPPPFPLLAWSSNGKWLLTVQQVSAPIRLQIVRVSVESGEVTPWRLFADSDRAHRNLGIMGGDSGLAISPNGRTLAFAHVSDLPRGSVFVVSLADDMLPAGQPRAVHFDVGLLGGIAWDSDGRDLLVTSDQRGSVELWRVPVDPQRKPAPLDIKSDNIGEIAVSKNAEELVFTHYSGDANIWRGELRGDRLTNAAPVIASTRFEHRAAYSSDGKHIAFESDRSGNEELWTTNADGSQPLQLTSIGIGRAGSPRWSPDDTRIAFDSNAAGKWDVYTVPSRGGQPVRFTWHSGASVRPSWSHDGKWIYYCASGSGSLQIWKKAASGGPELVLTKGGGGNPAESADGAYVYYLQTDSRSLWRVPAGGGKESEVLALPYPMQFAMGTHGAYVIESGAVATLKYLDFATGAVKVLGVLPGPVTVHSGVSVSPDEHWVLYGRNEFAGSQLMLVENFR